MKISLWLKVPMALFLVLAMCPPASALGVLTTNGSGCPSISDHHRFMSEMDKGNYAYRYPSQCVDLPRGTRVGNPIEKKRDRFGKGTTEFILVEIAGKGKYWTLASWVKVTPGGFGALRGAPCDLESF